MVEVGLLFCLAFPRVDETRPVTLSCWCQSRTVRSIIKVTLAMMCFRDKFGIVAVVNTRERREYGEEDGGEKGPLEEYGREI